MRLPFAVFFFFCLRQRIARQLTVSINARNETHFATHRGQCSAADHQGEVRAVGVASGNRANWLHKESIKALTGIAKEPMGSSQSILQVPGSFDRSDCDTMSNRSLSMLGTYSQRTVHGEQLHQKQHQRIGTSESGRTWLLHCGEPLRLHILSAFIADAYF